MSNVDELKERVRGLVNSACVDGYAEDCADAAIVVVLKVARDWRPEGMSEVDWINRSWEWRIDALLAELEGK